MMWVKLTLAPVVRASWLLRMSRLTSSRRAGTERTLVAVGTPRLASILATMRDAAPRRTVASSPPAPPIGAGAELLGAGAAADATAGAVKDEGAGAATVAVADPLALGAAPSAVVA